jgi:hypothetical protein
MLNLYVAENQFLFCEMLPFLGEIQTKICIRKDSAVNCSYKYRKGIPGFPRTA